MLDGKILAAVLASLAALGVATGGQTDGATPGPIDVPEMKSLNPRSLGAFAGLVNEETGTSEVNVELSYNRSDEQKLEIDSGIMEIDNLTAIQLGKQRVNSDSNLSIGGFKGTLTVSEESRIDGETNYIISNGVNISGEFKVSESLITDRINAEKVRDSSFVIEDVNGEINSGSTSATLSDSSTDVEVSDFSGEIQFRPQEGTVAFKGEVRSLEAGDVSIG